jgi:sensor histidine kinase YesM
MYWDGELIAENGTVGSERAHEQPGRIDFLAPLPSHLLTTGKHQLTLEISTFHTDETLSAIFYVLSIVDYHSAVARPFKQSGLAIFFMGSLLVISLLFLLLFWLYQHNKLYQIYSILCLSSALLLAAEKWRSLFGYTYDLHLTRLHVVLFLTATTCVSLLSFYLKYYRLNHMTRWLSGSVIVFGAVTLSSISYDGKSILLFLITFLSILGINLLSLWQKKPSAWINTLIITAALITLLVAPNDFLEDRFAIISFAIVLIMLTSLIQEMKRHRNQAMEAIRLEAELLKRNLQPHFLMNSLMLVIEWIEQKPVAAVKFIEALSKELRLLVTFTDKKIIPLSDEIDLCQRHIEIMAFRYNANFSLLVNGHVDNIYIPPAIIHTQVENAFSHNKIPLDTQFVLTITTHENEVVITFRSPLNKKSKNDSTGVGERYIHTRLYDAFGDRYTFTSNEEHHHWVSRIHFTRTV